MPLLWRSTNLCGTGGNKEPALPRLAVTHSFKSLQSSPNAAGKVKLPYEEESGHVRSAERSATGLRAAAVHCRTVRRESHGQRQLSLECHGLDAQTKATQVVPAAG